MTYSQLSNAIKSKGSFLCVGLDTDPGLIPSLLQKDTNPIFSFNMEIVDATAPYCIAYKLNTAFYEAEGTRGMEQMLMTVKYIRKKYPSMLIIADAKRGDIGNTAIHYAKAFFETYGFDAVTLSPYMGRDSIFPFLGYEDKWSIVLALTSNNSAEDFEMEQIDGKEDVPAEPLYSNVIRKVMNWGTKDNTMFVVGATRPEKIAEIRKYCPDHFLLVPGIGAQGGSLSNVAKAGMNKNCGLIANSSRSIIYASHGEDFASAAATSASRVAAEMATILA
ncbi:MAG: orotidine-5'-phosphate decarboxylase [Bacteroidales bacterium]|nr:orotidine-5'-phosphate decarboxylase [Bacteroidales bacterium]MCI2122363.1 orotidine-5'-phosphate decarboxylase [Bacteroidales bacterium]MCI2145675.1 orotidine-5'-phosphate decarboxylase [Bacteroidales bacterium]